MSDGLFELIPGPAVALLPLAAGVRLDGCPLAVAVAGAGGGGIAGAVGRGPVLIRSTTRCEGSVIMRSELTLVRRKVTRVWRCFLPKGLHVHFGPAHGVTDRLCMFPYVLLDDDLFDHARLFGYDGLLMGLGELNSALL